MHAELDEDEDLLVLPENPPPVEGWRLLELLQVKAQQERIGLEETAKRIGISRSYLSSLRYGQRKVSSLGREILDKCAEFLGMPLAGVLMAAEVIYPTDFVGGSRERARQEVQRAMQFFASDPDWAGFVDADWRSWSLNTQLMIVLLYQKAAGLELLPSLFDAKIASEAFSAQQPEKTP
ncbi:helix-turn-helix domain-containing protein [Hydrocarboniphaga effusa]|uniref:helix-turn-helix domain-containing protein n=1 Tax=Hydrocarboniphaga effusa TaxID=243629 RepID=UPI0035B1D8A9